MVWNLADFSRGVNEMSYYGLQLLGISDQDFCLLVLRALKSLILKEIMLLVCVS